MIESVIVFFVCLGAVLLLILGIFGIIKTDQEINNLDEKLTDEIENHKEKIKDECFELLNIIDTNYIIPNHEFNRIYDSMVKFYYNDEMEKLVKLRHMLRGVVRKLSEGVKV